MQLNDRYFLNPAHLELARARYFLKDSSGQAVEQDIDEVFQRTINHIYQGDEEHKEEALKMRREKKIIDAGRPLAQAGTQTSNLLNCFVIGFEDDTREAISDLKRKHFNIQAQGGGTGINFSTLRPSGSVCKSTQSRSSGAVGFITDFSYQSSNISQGGNRCLPGDSLVAMADGTWKRIIDIRPGDQVLAFDKKSGKTTPSNVVNFFENGIKDIYEYRLAGGVSVKSTDNHRWLGVQTDGNLICRTIDDMPKSSCKIGFVKETPYFGDKTSKWAGILGYLLGDGCFTGENIKLSVLNREIRKRFIDSLPEGVSYWENDESVFVSSDGELQDYLKHTSLYHCVSYEKFIPDDVFLYNRKDVISVIEGLIATDGWVSTEEIGFCSTSKQMVDDFRRLLLKFGISGYIQADNRPRKGKVRRTLWNFRIKHPDSYNQFLEFFDVPDKNKKAMIKTNSIQHKRRDDCVFHKVQEVICLGKDLTFDITIDHPDHLFIVDGAVTHNSGANMGMLEDWHPDLYEFITKKSESNWENIRKFSTIFNEDEFSYFQWAQPYQWQMFNVSVFVSDKLMEMVMDGGEEPWILSWDGEPWHLWEFKKTMGPKSGGEYVKTFTVTAPNKEMAYFKASTKIPFFNNKDLELVRGPFDMTANEWFSMICKNAWEDGCPGIIFEGTARKYHNAEYFNPLEATNPCAEQVLPRNAVCCLTSLVLPTFFVDGEFQWNEFERAIYQAVRGLDNIITVNKTGEEDIDKNSVNERRIGLGTTGIAELLILMGLKYSSQEGRDFAEKILSFLRDKSYEASIELAKERGPFPAYEYKGYSQSQFFKELPEHIRNLIKRHGIRNVTILTQAPTGTTGTMVGFSTGCEPYFAMCFNRNSRIGSFLDGSPAFISWLKEKNLDYADYDYSLSKLRKAISVPDYFEEAHEISVEGHLKMQAVFAKYIDSSVSKTINLPNSATIEDVKNAYLMAYKLGIKSTTVYRDGSKQQILEAVVKESDKKRPVDIVRAHAPKRPKELPCDINHTTVKGEKWTVIVGLLDGRPYEVFCAPQDNFEIAQKYKTGMMVKNGGGSYYLDTGDFKLKNISSYLNTDEHRVITRLISTCLRHGVPMSFISEQLAKVDGTVIDFSKAILRVLKKYGESTTVSGKDLVCSACGSTNVVLNSGCPECLDCGVSKCG